MKMSVRHKGEASVVSLQGELTIPCRERLKKLVEEIDSFRSVEVRLGKASTAARSSRKTEKIPIK